MNRVTKKYKQQDALENVSIEIKKGEVYGLIGRNGAGKTTLLKTITRLIEATEGEIQLFGSQTAREWTKNLQRAGSVIETPVAYEQLTAEQNLVYYCKLRGIVNHKQVIQETLELVDLAATGKKKFKNFSLGMKQKLGIAIAILSRPDFLILDEPINGLDPIAIIEFRKLIKHLNEEKGMTIIISSHILSELYHVATRFGIINEGKLIQEISKEHFDQLSQDYIVLKTPQIEDASRVISDALGYPLKVVGQDQLHIFGKSHHVNQIIQLLVKEKIAIDGIHYSKEDLEKYFTDLLSKEDIHHD